MQAIQCVEQRADGIWFSVEMAQSVRSPVGRVTETGQTPMERIARNGFYTFNVDIYVDTDRIAGLGETSTLPGRGVTVDRNYAWEKAIVLTPRPDVVATMLQMHYDNEFEAELRAHFLQLDPDAARLGHGARLFSRIAYVLQGLDALIERVQFAVAAAQVRAQADRLLLCLHKPPRKRSRRARASPPNRLHPCLHPHPSRSPCRSRQSCHRPRRSNRLLRPHWQHLPKAPQLRRCLPQRPPAMPQHKPPPRPCRRPGSAHRSG